MVTENKEIYEEKEATENKIVEDKEVYKEKQGCDCTCNGDGVSNNGEKLHNNGENGCSCDDNTDNESRCDCGCNCEVNACDCNADACNCEVNGCDCSESCDGNADTCDCGNHSHEEKASSCGCDGSCESDTDDCGCGTHTDCCSHRETDEERKSVDKKQGGLGNIHSDGGADNGRKSMSENKGGCGCGTHTHDHSHAGGERKLDLASILGIEKKTIGIFTDTHGNLPAQAVRQNPWWRLFSHPVPACFG